MRHIWLSIFLSLSLYADAHIYLFHRFDDVRYPSTNTSTKDLKRFFDYLKQNNYEVIPLKKLSKALKNSSKVNSKWVVLTIDDAFKSFYENAFELFKEYNYTFTLFVYPLATQEGYSDYMSWQELNITSKYGQIGAHSFDHSHLVSKDRDEIIDDTKKSLALFEKYGFDVKSYAYPYGEYDEELFKTIHSFGFETIVNQNSGAVNEMSSRFNLDRIPLTGEIDIKRALHFKHLHATWIKPLEYPKDNILKGIKLQIDKKFKNVMLYVSGFNWQKVKVKEGIIELLFDKKLNSKRVRIIVKSDDNRYSTKIIVKD